MAQLNQFQSFTRLFLPPEGYHTDFVELTTFTLSLRLLLQIPLLIHCGEQRTELPRQLNAAIKREGYRSCCKKFHIYCDGAAKAAVDDPSFYRTRRGQLAQYLKSACCTEVTVPGGLFHPKIMVFQFSRIGAPEEKRFRVHLSSRNLTMSGYLEAGVTLESAESGSSLAPIADFFAAQPKSELQGIDWAAFRHCAFVLPAGFDTTTIPKVSIHFGGPPRCTGCKSGETLLEQIRRDLTDYKAIRITSMNPTMDLFPREKAEYVCNFLDLYEEDSVRPGRWAKKGAWQKRPSAYVCRKTATGKKQPEEPRSLHIKQYLLYNAPGSPAAVWLGSANCSEHALQGANVEVMARFETTTDSLYKPFPDFANGTFSCDGTLGYMGGNGPVENPSLPPISDEESFLRLRVTAVSYEEAEEGQGILRLTVRNGEDRPVEAALPRGAESLRVGGKQERRLTFSVTKKHFANLLLAKKEDSSQWYTIPLPLPWKGYDLKTLTDRLPLDPMESVRELVPVAEGTYNPDDEAYERLVKWVVELPEGCRAALQNILTEIDLRQAEYCAYGADEEEIADDEEEEDALQTYLSVQSTYRFRKDLALLRELTEQMLRREDLI